MKVFVDFSIFTKDDIAYGNVSGELNLPLVPQIGDSLSFLFPEGDGILDSRIGFRGILKVTDRVISVNQESQQVALALSDVVVPTKNEALQMMKYFESAFDLFAISYSE